MVAPADDVTVAKKVRVAEYGECVGEVLAHVRGVAALRRCEGVVVEPDSGPHTGSGVILADFAAAGDHRRVGSDVRGEVAVERTHRSVVCYGVSESDEGVTYRSRKASVGPLAAGDKLVD